MVDDKFFDISYAVKLKIFINAYIERYEEKK